MLPLSVVILTYNEEKNIRECIESVQGWAQEIFVVDSFSTDQTLAIVASYHIPLVQHPFENYAQQRNWALANLPFTTDWVINLDADNRITPQLREELTNRFQTGIPPELNGFLASRRTIFMGKWIRYGGHYPTYHAFLFRRGHGFCENRLYDQHFVVEGNTQTLRGDIIDILTDSLDRFTERHNRWASLEADEQLALKSAEGMVQGDLAGNPIEQRRALRNFYNRMPLFVRPFLYFFVRYFLRLGFLDGKTGLIFHFLQGFWYRFLIDAKLYEKIKKK